MPGLKDTMKKLRKRAYEKSGKKYKDIGRFGEDEYMKQDKLPGMKRGGMSKQEYNDMVDKKIKSREETIKKFEKEREDFDLRRKAKEKSTSDSLEKQREEFYKKLEKKKATEGSFKKGGLAGKQKKLDANKDGKISGEDFKILRGKANKMKGGGIAIKGTNFKGVF